MDKVFLRGGQLAQTGGILGVIIGTLLGNLNLQLPIILAGALCLVLGIVLLRVMPEEHFSPALEDRQGLLNDFINLFRLNLRFVKGAPVLLALLLITFCGGLASEGFDRLSTAHFLNDTAMPTFGPLNSVTWFGFMSLLGSGLGIFASGVLIARMEKRSSVSRTGVVLFTSAGYIVCLLLFAFGGNFWFLLLIFLLAGLMRTLKEPVLAAWMNDRSPPISGRLTFRCSGRFRGSILWKNVLGNWRLISVRWRRGFPRTLP